MDSDYVYGDEDSKESMEEVAADGTFQIEDRYLRIDKVMSTSEPLNYRERVIIAEHPDFYGNCYATHYYAQEDLDADGKPKRKARRKVPFIELAPELGLASSDAADKIYRRALEKMRKTLSK